MKVYIAGAMTGIPDLNFPAFAAEALRLRGLGYEVVSPAELNPDHSMPWAACMRRDIPAMLGCEAVIALPGHETSRGARLELLIARELAMPVLDATTVVAGPDAE